jgi:hypothetical protein
MLAPRSDFLWHRILLHGEFQLVRSQLDELCQSRPSLNSAADLIAFEQAIQESTQRLHALLCAMSVQDSLASPPFRQAIHRLFAAYPKPLKNQGRRRVALRFSQGAAVDVYLPYYSRSKAAPGLRSKGCFPALLLLGIHDRCSPALARDLTRLVALLGSFREARSLLVQRGIALSVNSLRKVAYHYAQRVRSAQRNGRALAQESLKGRVVVITTDGGRIRIRKDRKAKTKKGRKRFSTNWREPKLLMIYTVKQEKGRLQMDRSFLPIVDGTLQGPDALFALMRHYLQSLKIEEADKVLFVGDGARWIWKRAEKLLRSLKVPPKKIHQAVDFYHAVEHLSNVADLAKCFSEKQKKRWLKKQCQRLQKGQTEEVIVEVEGLATKYPTTKMTTELGYLMRHGREFKRMDYAKLAKLGLPLGSGAIESAIRRVINLRLKGAGIFWHKQSAESMILLRCYAKAGRSQDLDALAFADNLSDAA